MMRARDDGATTSSKASRFFAQNHTLLITAPDALKAIQ
jgi:hypothetical protein